VRNELLPQGADLCESGVRYRVWSPESAAVSVEIQPAESPEKRVVPLALDAAGYHHGIDPLGRAGDRYKFRMGGEAFPDPASRWQPEGVHGPSMVIDPGDYGWHDAAWKRPRFRDLSIYELHIGAFTPEGTFLAAIDKLGHLRGLGITAIELMPIADFPGERNWGYDGVSLYAPARAYGHPDDLRALVDAAHGADLAVVLDVVYNHFGPDGNFLGAYSAHYFNHGRKTPWGDSFNFDGNESGPVRAFFVSNPIYWMEEFHIDGFRLDATHAIGDESPRHILEEIAGAIHDHGGFSIAEDARNEARLILSPKENGWGFDGVWADDFHHAIRVLYTRESDSYFEDFDGSQHQVIETLRNGWLYRGQYSPHRKGKRGTECRHLSPQKFVHCISNHDQVGNRAFGDRLNHSIPAEAYRAASALLCLTPYTPMFFMGQEWAASTPFQFFTDHNEELGALVTKGRRGEFKEFSAFLDEARLAQIPDPQSPKTFQDSKLNWAEMKSFEKREIFDLYRAFLHLRNGHAAFRPESRETWRVEELSLGAGAIRFQAPGIDWLILFDLLGGHRGALNEEWICKLHGGRAWRRVLSSNESRFGGTLAESFDDAAQHVAFEKPEVLVLDSAHE